MNGIRKNDGSVDGARVAVLVGASIGLGLLVHEVFFLVGGAIAVGALAAAVAGGTPEQVQKPRLAHHHP